MSSNKSIYWIKESKLFNKKFRRHLYQKETIELELSSLLEKSFAYFDKNGVEIPIRKYLSMTTGSKAREIASNISEKCNISTEWRGYDYIRNKPCVKIFITAIKYPKMTVKLLHSRNIDEAIKFHNELLCRANKMKSMEIDMTDLDYRIENHYPQSTIIEQ